MLNHVLEPKWFEQRGYERQARNEQVMVSDDGMVSRDGIDGKTMMTHIIY